MIFSYLPFVEKNDSITISQFTFKRNHSADNFSIAPNDTNPDDDRRTL